MAVVSALPGYEQLFHQHMGTCAALLLDCGYLNLLGGLRAVCAASLFLTLRTFGDAACVYLQGCAWVPRVVL
jgi:hypothetical protein